MDKHSSTQNTETLLLFEVTLKLDKFCGTEDGQKGTILLFCLDESIYIKSPFVVCPSSA